MMEQTVRPLGDKKRHYWLALGMAKVSGADLQRALDEGRITHQDWAEAVQRCRGCAWADGCDCWMKAQEAETHATVPQACANVGFFDGVLSEDDQAGKDPISS